MAFTELPLRLSKKMKIRCAWHKKNFGFELFMGEKEPLEDTSITDGICPECYKKEIGEEDKRECNQLEEKDLIIKERR